MVGPVGPLSTVQDETGEGAAQRGDQAAAQQCEEFWLFEDLALRGSMSAPATYGDSTLSDKPVISPVRLAIASAFRPVSEG